MAEFRVYPSDPVKDQKLQLSLIDAYGPKIWIRQVHFFPLKEGQTAEKSLEAFRQGLSRTLSDIPALSGTVARGGEDPRNVIVDIRAGSSVEFLYEDLTNTKEILSYAELAALGFPATDVGPLLLPPITSTPIIVGSPIITVKLNKIKGGLILGFGLNHVFADASVVAHVEKTWASHTNDFSAGKKQSHWERVDIEKYLPQISTPYAGAPAFEDENMIVIPTPASQLSLPGHMDSAKAAQNIIAKLGRLMSPSGGKKKAPKPPKPGDKGDLKGLIAIVNRMVVFVGFLTAIQTFFYGPPKDGQKPFLWFQNGLTAFLNGMIAIKEGLFGPPDQSNNPKWSMWYFSTDDLARLKADMSPDASSGQYISTNDALIGLFWARVSFIKQLGLSGFQTSQLVFPMNIRHRVEPNIDARMFGNIVDIMTVKCDFADLESPRGVTAAALSVRKAILGWSQPHWEAWVTKAVTLPPTQAICPNPVKLLAPYNFGYNDYSRSQTNVIDWGKDVGTVERIRYPRPAQGTVPACRVHPRLPDGGLEVALAVSPAITEALKKDEIFSKYANLVCFPA